MNKVFETATMDTQTRIFTIILVPLLLSVPFILFLMEDEEIPKAAFIFPSIMIITALVVSYLLIPKLAIHHKSIVIKNNFVNINIPISDIVGIKKFDRVGFNIRTFGVGGLFGYFGYFNGNDIWYVTNIKKKIKIQTHQKLYVISPEEPDEFIENVNQLLSEYRKNL